MRGSWQLPDRNRGILCRRVCPHTETRSVLGSSDQYWDDMALEVFRIFGEPGHSNENLDDREHGLQRPLLLMDDIAVGSPRPDDSITVSIPR